MGNSNNTGGASKSDDFDTDFLEQIDSDQVSLATYDDSSSFSDNESDDDKNGDLLPAIVYAPPTASHNNLNTESMLTVGDDVFYDAVSSEPREFNFPTPTTRCSSGQQLMFSNSQRFRFANAIIIPSKSKDELEAEYVEKLKEYRLQMHPFREPSETDKSGMQWCVAYSYQKHADALNTYSQTLATRMKRIQREVATLGDSIPVALDSSVYVCIDENRPDLVKALLTGPEDTPYAHGCFEFDVFFPEQYPHKPPMVTFATTVINTWSGSPSEQWNPYLSLHKVLLAIQAFVFVRQPFFNEPGFGKMAGRDWGERCSKRYNARVRHATLLHAILAQIRNPSPCFREVIREHCRIKAPLIKATAAEWLREMKEMNAVMTGEQQPERHARENGGSDTKDSGKLIPTTSSKTPSPGTSFLSFGKAHASNGPSASVPSLDNHSPSPTNKKSHKTTTGASGDVNNTDSSTKATKTKHLKDFADGPLQKLSPLTSGSKSKSKSARASSQVDGDKTTSQKESSLQNLAPNSGKNHASGSNTNISVPGNSSNGQQSTSSKLLSGLTSGKSKLLRSGHSGSSSNSESSKKSSASQEVLPGENNGQQDTPKSKNKSKSSVVDKVAPTEPGGDDSEITNNDGDKNNPNNNNNNNNNNNVDGASSSSSSIWNFGKWFSFSHVANAVAPMGGISTGSIERTTRRLNRELDRLVATQHAAAIALAAKQNESVNSTTPNVVTTDGGRSKNMLIEATSQRKKSLPVSKNRVDADVKPTAGVA